VAKIISQFMFVCLFMFSMFNALASEVAVSQGHVREVIPGNSVTSSYFTLTNNSQKAIKLIGASSPSIPRIEIHEHIMADGMMKMRKKAFVEIAPQESVVFQPMGLHLMMFDIQTPLKAGQQIKLNLLIENEQPVEITLPVQSIKRAKKHVH